tara:strand:+ start:263 stop:538 length:276 start_codon:yes stop_codon:yes gene_type:complete
MKLKTEKKKQFEIENSKDVALWESIPCICQKDNVMKSHPIQTCESCKCKIAWDSVPQKSFIVKDEKGKDKTINKIKLIRGKFEDVIAWSFN